MRTICEEPWRHRLGSSSLQKVVAFRAEELTLGCGTVLWKAASGLSNILSLSSDAAHDRLVALLVVAGRGHLAKAALLQLDTALNEWHRGDHALAAIRLALVRLPAVRDLGEAHTLFLAEIALDAGLSPNDLLKELGYARCLPLLKDYRTQPRVPPGCGPTSGQWTCDASGISFAPNDAPVSFKPIADGDGTTRPIPVFLRPEGGDAEENDVDDKARRLLDDTIEERIREGRPLPKEVPGTFEIVPSPELAPAAPPRTPNVGNADPGAPQTGPVPLPIPIPVPGADGPSSGDKAEDEGPACPIPQRDVGRGRNASGDEFEYSMSLLINPESPTPKYSSDKPVISEAYFLPSTAPSGRVSFDDCKLRNTPTTLPIPALKPGDMFELKAGGWGWELGVPGSAAYRQFRNQLKNQNEAVATEGRGRQIYYCVPSAAKAISAAKIFGGAYPNSHFLVCR